MDGCTHITIDGGHLGANAFDIAAADGGLFEVNIEIRSVTSRGSDTSVVFEVSPGKQPPSGIRIIGCDLSARDRVLRVLNDQEKTRCYNDVQIAGGTFTSETAASVIEFTQGNFTPATGYRVEDATIRANGVGIMASGLQGSLVIKRTTVIGMGKLTCGIAADDCPRLDWDAITFRNIADGYGYAARSLRGKARGSLHDLRFEQVARPSIRGSVTG